MNVKIKIVYVFLLIAVRHYMRKVVEGLLYLHSYGILHRDLTLANLLLTKDMDVVGALLLQHSHSQKNSTEGLNFSSGNLFEKISPYHGTNLTRIIHSLWIPEHNQLCSVTSFNVSYSVVAEY